MEYARGRELIMGNMYRLNFVTIELSDSFVNRFLYEFREKLMSDNSEKIGILKAEAARNKIPYEKFIMDYHSTYTAKDFLSQIDIYKVFEIVSKKCGIVRFNIDMDFMNTYFENFRVGYDIVLNENFPLLSLIMPRILFDAVDFNGLEMYALEHKE